MTFNVDSEFFGVGQLKPDFNMGLVCLRQMDRLNQAIAEGDQFKVENILSSLLAPLPPANRKRARERITECVITRIKWIRQTKGGFKLSDDPMRPTYGNKPGSHSYDPKRPTRRWTPILDDEGKPTSEYKIVYEVGGLEQISPLPDETEDSDLITYNDVVQDEYLALGLTFKTKKFDFIRSPDEVGAPDTPPSNPLFDEDEEKG